MSQQVDLLGQRFGKLIVVESAGSNGRNKLWKCRCDCGTIHIVSTALLRGGKTKSCGCYREEFRKLDGQGAAKRRLLSTYKREANKRGIQFLLDDDKFFDIISKNCYYCGVEPQNTMKPSHYDSRDPERWLTYNGVDRLDSSKGYENDNVVPCCWVCNKAKNNMSEEQFKAWLKRTYTHLFKRLVEKTPGVIADEMFTTLMKCWNEQEKMLRDDLTDEERSVAGKKAQELNDRRNRLIRSFDELLDFEQNSPTEKTYHTYFEKETYK